MRDNRIIYSDAGVLTDYTKELNNVLSSTATLVIETADYLFLGSELPFNNRYLDISTANTNSSVLSISLWDGTTWRAAVDILDGTSSGGKTFAQSGVISWSPDWDVSSWASDDTDEMTSSGLETGPKIKELYWARLAVSANLSAGTALKSVGYKFSEDEDLEAEYPELANSTLKTAYKAGKTDWKDQTLVAAQYIIRDLKAMNVVKSANQILDVFQFKKASVHRTAAIVFSAFGDDYKDQVTEAIKAYNQSMQLKFFKIDQNQNAELDPMERRALSTFLTR